MDTERLSNPIVRAAIQALQGGDKDAWAALFAPDATLYDDGSPRSLLKFTEEALGHERFTSLFSAAVPWMSAFSLRFYFCCQRQECFGQVCTQAATLLNALQRNIPAIVQVENQELGGISIGRAEGDLVG